MFSSQRQYAESITQPSGFKIKVAVEGHVLDPFILYPIHISFSVETIIIKLWSSVHISETVCGTHNSTMQTQGQGHNWRSWIWALHFLSAPYVLYHWKDFH